MSMNLDAEEYLDRYGVTAYMKDVVTLLLENRPAAPIAFIARYFRTVTQGSSPLLRAYRYIQLAPPSQTAFVDNLVAAYVALDMRRGASYVSGTEVLRLLRLLCADCPVDISSSLLRLVGCSESEPVSFESFSAAVRAGLHLEDLFQRASALFAACDPHGTGRVPRSVLELALRHIGVDAYAADVALAYQQERLSRMSEAVGPATTTNLPTPHTAALAPSAPAAPPVARTKLRRLQREVEWEVARLETRRITGGAGAADDTHTPSASSMVNLEDFVRALLDAAVLL
jgi:hypothetical protein